MDSVDAECLAIDLALSEGATPPDQWQHPSDGTLAFRFGDSENTYSWSPAEVARMAARWRAADRAVPQCVAKLAAGHRAFAKLVDESDLDPPSRVIHDLRADEVSAVWDESKLVVIVGDA